MTKILILTSIILGLTSCENNSLNQPTDTFSNLTIDDSVQTNLPTEITINHQVALDFMDSYILNCNKMNKAQNIVDWTMESPLVTEKFKATLKKMVTDAFIAEPEYGLGFDPIIDGQDYPDEGFEFDSFNSKTGEVIIKGIGQESNKLTIKLVVENGKTLVDGCGAVNIHQVE